MSTSHMSRAAVGVAALLLAVLVSGCEEDEPSTSPTPSSSPSEPESSSPSEPTTTPTGPVEPTLPAGAEAETNAGAKAFVSHYWEVVNYSQLTGDVALLKSLSAASCAGCKAGIESIAKIYRRGGQIVGGRFSVLSLSPGRTPSGAWNVAARVRVGDREVSGAGSANESSESRKVGFLFGLDRDDGIWIITFLDVA